MPDFLELAAGFRMALAAARAAIRRGDRDAALAAVTAIEAGVQAIEREIAARVGDRAFAAASRIGGRILDGLLRPPEKKGPPR